MNHMTDDKLISLKAILNRMGSVLVAYSGGVDSSFLAATAYDVLGPQMLAVFEYSPVSPPSEREAAESLAKMIGFRYKYIPGNELTNPEFVANPPERCYYCRKELFAELKKIAADEGLTWIADGTNADDMGDYRPGRKAGAEMGIRSPLLEAGLTKDEIRTLSRERNLPTWNKPASPCLASRIPYGTPVTPDVLVKIAEGEQILRSIGLRQLRLRHHGDVARIEVDAQDMGLIIKEGIRLEIVNKLKTLGYKYVTLDLAGYRTGSLNEGIVRGNNQ